MAKVRRFYVVWRDPERKGFWHGPHGRYTNRPDAEMFARELVRRLGGDSKITVETVEIKPRKKSPAGI